ncbi:MAG: rod shape-determining protein RodA [Rickettsiaceae bacterium]|nr:rod shape-determining protein RodA [Rickettsiaceae bacterium]
MNYRLSFNQLSKLPQLLLCFIVINCIFGFVILYSAGQNNLYPWAIKQMIHFVIFFVIMLSVAFADIRIIYQYSYSIFFLVIGLLFTVTISGHSSMGATRWLNLGGFLKIQPSELAKLALVLFLSKYFHNLSDKKVKNTLYLIPPSLAIILVSGLVILQPDLGTGIVIILVSSILFFISGVKLKIFGIATLCVLSLSPVFWYKLHDYQKRRIEIFFNPDKDPLGSGYNIIQSKIAIGSGGFFGRGLGQGSQSHLSFLPEHQTDFIFSCISEDLGFIGGLTLIVIYGIIIYASLAISINAKALYLKFLSIGIVSIFFCHIFINIGMVTGLLPVVGIPLPLVSYGGTVLGTMLIGFGLIMNIHINHSIKLS